MEKDSVKKNALYEMLEKRHYPEQFCLAVTHYLNTDFTARRMMGFLYHMPKASMEDVADEMLAILEDRQAIMEKKRSEAAQAAYTRYLNERPALHEDEE